MNAPVASRSACDACTACERSALAGLPPRFQGIVDRVKVVRDLARGDVLFHEGAPMDGLHCVGSGVIGLRMLHPNGSDVLVDLAYPGDTLGCRAFLRGGSHGTSAVALTDARVCTLRARDALRLAREAPDLRAGLIRHCLEAMDRAQATILRAAAMSNRQRLCHLLLRLLRTHGDVVDGAVTAQLPLSRADMAGMLAIQPESLSRLFRRLREEGLIDCSGRTVRVRSLAALQGAA